jgi:putative ABC transport system permease protein
MRQPAGRSVFRLRDLAAEALAGVLQRPARSALTMVGTVLGVGAFVAVLGLTSTATGQIGRHFDALRDTTVTVVDVGEPNRPEVGEPGTVSFPPDADGRMAALNGAVAAGVRWKVPLHEPVIGASLAVEKGSPASAGELPVHAVSAGLFAVVSPSVRMGAVFNTFHDGRGERVAVLGAAAAKRLGINQLAAQPAIFINGTAFTVVGIIDEVRRMPDLLLGILIPRTTAARLYPAPDPARNPAEMAIETRIGAAGVIARQAPVALRPDRPELLKVQPPADPRTLRAAVDTDLAGLFLGLAGICLLVGAVGIANTTLVAVLERVGEIGLRRALGARPRHIAVQFLTESTVLGVLGGLIGTALGVGVVVVVAMVKDWTALLEPVTVLPAPLLGGLVGMLAGVYPAIRAATIEPLEALRR